MKTKTPRWKYWKAQKSWTLVQAACLINNIEPPDNAEDFTKLCQQNPRLDEIFWAAVEAAQTGELATMPPLDS